MALKKISRLTDTISPVDVSAQVGSVVYPDGSPASCRVLRPCTHWDQADFVWDVFGNGPIKEVAVNIYVTGRTQQFKGSALLVKVKIEFVGDGEPSTCVDGWMCLDSAKCEYADV